MYYYILEQSENRAQARFRDRLSDMTTDLGIAGEMVAKSSLKSIEDLIEIALKKGYTTIVAVGSDSHIAQVATALMHRPATDRPVLGVVPTDRESFTGLMVGASDFRAALHILKLRHLAYATMTTIEPGRFILTQAAIRVRKPVVFEIDVDLAHLEVPATEVVLTGDGRVIVRNQAGESNMLVQGMAWFFGATLIDRSQSVFMGERIRVNAPQPLSLQYEDETIAKTPFVAQLVRRALKIIIARATLESENQSNPVT